MESEQIYANSNNGTVMTKSLRQSLIMKERWKNHREEMLKLCKIGGEASSKIIKGKKLPQWLIEKRKKGRLEKNNGKYFSDEGYKKSYVTGLHKENALKNGYWFSDETRKKMSEARKGRFKGKDHPRWSGGKNWEKKCEICGKIFYVIKSDIGRKKFCSRQCSGVNTQIKQPKKDTNIERILEAWLNEKGIGHERNKPLFGKTLVDFFIKPNICVYADGDYWHRIPKIKERDERITKLLKDNGYTVYRLWEHEINEGLRPPVYIR